MFNGAHVVIYSTDAEADRAFMSEVIGLKSVDAGAGWLIFALPPAELAFHPHASSQTHELYFMCDDVKQTRDALLTRGVACSEITEQRWGSLSSFTLPGGGSVGFYQPRHERP